MCRLIKRISIFAIILTAISCSMCITSASAATSRVLSTGNKKKIIKATPVDKFSYSHHDGMIRIDNLNDKSLTKVRIPDTIDSYPVTSINNHAFSDCYNLTDIALPNSITSIGRSAFHNCRNLKNITIPEGVTSIRESTFENCGNLINITLPKSITFIGQSAFSGCYSLFEISLPSGLIYISGQAFSNCSNLTELHLPSSLFYIGHKAFSNCTNLTTIEIPSAVSLIRSFAFSGCPRLKNIITPRGSYAGQYTKKFDYVKADYDHVLYDSNNILTGRKINVSYSLPNDSSTASGTSATLASITIFNADGSLCYSQTIDSDSPKAYKGTYSIEIPYSPTYGTYRCVFTTSAGLIEECSFLVADDYDGSTLGSIGMRFILPGSNEVITDKPLRIVFTTHEPCNGTLNGKPFAEDNGTIFVAEIMENGTYEYHFYTDRAVTKGQFTIWQLTDSASD